MSNGVVSMVRSVVARGALAACGLVPVLAGCPPPADLGWDVASTRDAGLDVNDAERVPDVVVDDVPPMPDVATDAVVPDGGCTPTRVLVATSDTMMHGGYATSPIAAPTLAAVSPPSGTTINADHLVRASSCTTFDLLRSGFSAAPNTVAVIDPSTPFAPLHTATLPVIPAAGDGGMAQSADPVDVALVAPDRAYVALYNSARITIVDPTTGAVSPTTIDLSPFADADGLPEPGGIAVAQGRAFVALQRLDRTMAYAAAPHALLAVIDTSSNALIDADPSTAGTQAITLGFANPGATDPHIALAADGATLIVAEAGGYGGAPVGGIDVVDAASARVVRSITAAALGGAPISVEVVSDTVAWAAVEVAGADGGMTFAIKAFDFRTGDVTAAPIAQSPTRNYGWLRRAPDGTVWALDVAFGAAGTLFAYHADGSAVAGSPFAVPGGATATSFEFVP